VVCDLKSINRYTKFFRINATVYRPVSDVHLHLINHRKTHANRYMPGMFNLTLDVCDLMQPNSAKWAFFKEIVTRFYVTESKRLLAKFHPCPYEGIIDFDELRNEKPTVGFSIAEPGEYLTEVWLGTSKHKLYLGVKIFTLVKIAGMN
jgi:Protein of unknown function (DUF1091)